MIASVYGGLRRRNGPCSRLRLRREAEGHRRQIAAPIQAFDKHSVCFRYNIWHVPQRGLPLRNAQNLSSAGIPRPTGEEKGSSSNLTPQSSHTSWNRAGANTVSSEKRHLDYTSINLDNQADIPGLTVVIFLECGSMMIATLPSFCA